MTDTKWSEWINWAATGYSVCPLEDGTLSQVLFSSGDRACDNKCPEEWDWNDTGGLGTITAYRYELTEDPDARMDNIARNGNDGEHYYSDITAYDPPGPTSMPECTFTTPDEDEAWREVEKKINPVWQSPHDFGGVCVFHGCRYSAYEQCYMCVLAGEAAKEEAKQPAYNPEDVAFVRAEGKQPGYPGRPASKYHVQIKGQWVDVYDILTAYSVTNPADAHAIKKMLCPGKRGAKDGIQDRQEAIVSLQRAIELEQLL